MTDNADLAGIRTKWLAFCSHDLGLPYPCICPDEDHRPVIAALVGEVETLRAEVARLERSREKLRETLDEARANAANDQATLRGSLLEELDLVTDQRAFEADRADKAASDLAALHAEAARLRAALDLALAEVARLSQTIEVVAATLTRCREVRDDYGNQAQVAESENEHLRAERDKAHELVDRLMAKWNAALDDRDALVVERDVMRLVVEAAGRYVEAWRALDAYNGDDLQPVADAMYAARSGLVAAVDQKAPSSQEIVAPPEVEEAPSGAIDLMAALRASIDRAKAARESGPVAARRADGDHMAPSKP